MSKQEILQLIDRYLDGTANEEEIGVLMEYYNSFQQQGQWSEELGDSRELEDAMLKRLTEALRVKPSAKSFRFFRTRFAAAAAAVIVLLISATLWLVTSNTTQKKPVARVQPLQNADSAFTSGKAILTLADGRKILLDDASNGILARQANSTVHKQNGALIYEAGNAAAAVATTYNTIATQRGGEYLVVLPDGTKVWLNAASSLRFPPAFAGAERQVEITGEAYFEVAKNPAMPFKVAVINNGKNRGVVEVLGTHFNINSYDGEGATQTTLLEGSVKITPVINALPAAGSSQKLVAGQQARINSNSGVMKIVPADVEEVMAWKNGLFYFNDADIKTIMRQVARWYDVEVAYDGHVTSRTFSGKIKRSAEITNVLAILEQSGIHFNMKGRRIVVKP
ncbi:FecR family protein [Foetidibacter luteolus]|uniref:FecR family protein n=1 Tax=Foetidibacter luteolus TaxID=2608880 RepID=UPI00129BD658|nr:FecR family protein [Foetidibacter luteolus]